MKQLNILLAAVFFCTAAMAQADTTVQTKKNDTMRIGNIVIIKKGKKYQKDDSLSTAESRKNFERKQKSRVSTNWWIVDLGFSNYDDQTNYGLANAGSYLAGPPSQPLSKGDFKVRTGKSINVNIWLFMQRVNLIKKNVNLKYGLGVELNNYRYKSNIAYRENGLKPNTGMQSNDAFVFRDSISYSKNKLAADYVTIPVMLNFSTTPRHNRQTVSFSVGVSGGYLYSQRNKQVSDQHGKKKNKGDYDLEKFKYSYIAEVGVGPVRFYGSYSPRSIYERDLDMRPYNFGIRFSSW
jgi:Outer membrane protein beta-barrel domain